MIKLYTLSFFQAKERLSMDNPDWAPTVSMGSKPPRTTLTLKKDRYKRRVMRD